MSTLAALVPRSRQTPPDDVVAPAIASLITRASSLIPTQRLVSTLPVLNDFLEGGLPIGAVTEWGAPMGRGGRELLIPFIAAATSTRQNWWCLWANGWPKLGIYPPAWAARGVNLERMRCVRLSKGDNREDREDKDRPVSQLKPILSDATFRMIVLDLPVSPSKDEWAFLAHQARKWGKVIVVLRDQENLAGEGVRCLRVASWREDKAPLALDCQRPLGGRIFLRTLRGQSPRQIAVSY